jgi:hypothetical protein
MIASLALHLDVCISDSPKRKADLIVSLDSDKLDDKAAAQCAPATRYGSRYAVSLKPSIIHMPCRPDVAKYWTGVAVFAWNAAQVAGRSSR